MRNVLLVFLLVCAANAIPLLAHALWRNRGAWPLDGGRRFPDGRPIFGPSKTLRGVVLSLALTPLIGWSAGLFPELGFRIAAGAMAGDLLSSFIKRRMGRPAGSRALGLDQIPEVAIPLLLVRRAMGLSWVALVLLSAAFMAFELMISRALFRAHIREHPY
ncbi:MAG: CDP-archaeol synthase [Kiritimatiellae bacterium]|nr:CDP-archaeol synthase [Kiritimatiellia bacterium]